MQIHHLLKYNNKLEKILQINLTNNVKKSPCVHMGLY